MTPEEKYQETVDGIALARRTVEQTSRTIRDAMDNGDDPVIFLHNLAGSLGKESPFQTGGQGSAIYVVACFLLAESGFFEPRDQVCVCPAPEKGEYLAHCPIHRGSWAETLEILADRELTEQLTTSIEDLGDIEESFVEALSAAAPYCSGYCSELPGIVAATHDPRCSEYKEPCCSGHDRMCTAVDICCCGCPEMTEEEEEEVCQDPDCDHPECDGDHDSLRCPTTGYVRGNIATVNGKWICCGGDYPNHAERKTCACGHVIDDHMSLIGPCTMGCDCIRFEAWGSA